MERKGWDKETIAALRFRVTNKQVADFAGYDSSDALYESVEVMGDSPDPDIRDCVLDILYHLDTERSFSFLVKCLNDKDAAIRWGAVNLLRYWGPRITHLMVPLLRDDPDVDVRSEAAGVLGNFGTPEVLPVLRLAAERDHEVNRRDGCPVSAYAQRAIKEIVTRSQPVALPPDPSGLRSLKRPQLWN